MKSIDIIIDALSIHFNRNMVNKIDFKHLKNINKNQNQNCNSDQNISQLYTDKINKSQLMQREL